MKFPAIVVRLLFSGLVLGSCAQQSTVDEPRPLPELSRVDTLAPKMVVVTTSGIHANILGYSRGFVIYALATGCWDFGGTSGQSFDTLLTTSDTILVRNYTLTRDSILIQGALSNQGLKTDMTGGAATYEATASWKIDLEGHALKSFSYNVIATVPDRGGKFGILYYLQSSNYSGLPISTRYDSSLVAQARPTTANPVFVGYSHGVNNSPDLTYSRYESTRFNRVSAVDTGAVVRIQFLR